MQRECLELRNVSMIRQGYRQLQHLNLRLFTGETLALVGKNGAGKAALCQLLLGEQKPESGHVFLHHQPASLMALRSHVALVRQGSRLLYHQNIAENLYIPPLAGQGRFFYSPKWAARQSRDVLTGLGIDIDPLTAPQCLSPMMQHLMLIVAHYIHQKQVVLLFGTAAAYNPEETAFFCQTLRRLNQRGLSIVYFSTQWDALVACSDRTSVLRDGCCVKSFGKGAQNQAEVQRHMYGYLGDLQRIFVESKQQGSVAFWFKQGPLHAGELWAIFDPDAQGDAFLQGIYAEALRQKARVAQIDHGSYDKEWMEPMSVQDNLLISIAPRISSPLGYIRANIRRALRQESASRLNLSEQLADIPMEHMPKSKRIALLFYRWKQRRTTLFLLQNATLACDFDIQNIIYEQIKQVLEQGIPVIFISGDIREICQLSSQPMQLKQGQLIPCSLPAQERKQMRP